MKINGKEYKFEFTVEASLCDECVEKVTSFVYATAEAQSDVDRKKTVMALANIPQTAFAMFYGGLLEHHGTGPNGDKSIRSRDDAKVLIGDYFRENPDGNYYEILDLMMEQMGKDGFFKRLGIAQMMEKAQAEAKKPQDHKKAGGK